MADSPFPTATMRPHHLPLIRLWLSCVLLVLAGSVLGAGSDDAERERVLAEARRNVEMSMTVTGTIDITADGSVRAYAIDNADKIPASVRETVSRIAPAWKFEPIPLRENAYSLSKMHLVFIAKKLDEDKYAVRLHTANFSDPTREANPQLDPKRFRLPLYPDFGRANVTGTVFLVIRYDRTGRIHDHAIERVNLRVVGSESQMASWRRLLTRATLDAAKHWRILVPPGAFADDETHGMGRIAVSFEMDGLPPLLDGQWVAYVPGPRNPIPWWDGSPAAATEPEALPPGVFHDANSGRRLVSPLGQE